MPEPPLTSTTRRGFLRLAGTAAAFSTVARLPLAAASRAGESGNGHFFSADERRILTRIVERMVASDDPAAPAVGETRSLDAIDRLCAGLDPDTTRPLPLLLRLVEWWPFLFELRFSRFSGLGNDEKDASLRGWMNSRFELRRQGFLALRNLSFLGYYSQEETWPAIGYLGPLLHDDPLHLPEDGRS